MKKANKKVFTVGLLSFALLFGVGFVVRNNNQAQVAQTVAEKTDINESFLDTFEFFPLMQDVTPDPEPQEKTNNISTGKIVALVIVGSIILFVIGFYVYWFMIKNRNWADLASVFKKKK